MLKLKGLLHLEIGASCVAALVNAWRVRAEIRARETQVNDQLARNLTEEANQTLRPNRQELPLLPENDSG